MGWGIAPGAGRGKVYTSRLETSKRYTMSTKNDAAASASKTLGQREEELRSLMASPQGRADLEALAARYERAGWRSRPSGKSVITYIIVHERERGLIEG